MFSNAKFETGFLTDLYQKRTKSVFKNQNFAFLFDNKIYNLYIQGTIIKNEKKKIKDKEL